MKQESSEDAVARVRAIFGTNIDVKPISEPIDHTSDAEITDLLTRVCYFYPQYNLIEADKLTDSQVTALLLQAEKQRAIGFYNLTLIAAAPNSKKGQLVSKLIKQYKQIAEM